MASPQRGRRSGGNQKRPNGHGPIVHARAGASAAEATAGPAPVSSTTGAGPKVTSSSAEAARNRPDGAAPVEPSPSVDDDDSEELSKVGGWAVGVATAAIPTVLALIRVSYLSHGDLQSISTILENLNVLAFLGSLTISAFRIGFLSFVVLGICMQIHWKTADAQTRKRRAWPLLASLVLVGVGSIAANSSTDNVINNVTIVLTGAFLLTVYQIRGKSGGVGKTLKVAAASVSLMVVTLSLSALLSVQWMALEVVEVSTAVNESVVSTAPVERTWGRVLAVSDIDTTLLRDDGSIDRIPNWRIEGRAVCPESFLVQENRLEPVQTSQKLNEGTACSTALLRPAGIAVADANVEQVTSMSGSD